LNSDISKHLLIDDHEIGTIPKNMQIKVGAFLTNLMCKNLKFKLNNHQFLLLKPQVIASGGKVKGADVRKYLGYINFNRSFIDQFISELDKIHDLNL
jgi:hypothetical protein